MARTSETFTTETEARDFLATLDHPRHDAILIEEKNKEDFRNGCTSTQCRTLWWRVAYTPQVVSW